LALASALVLPVALALVSGMVLKLVLALVLASALALALALVVDTKSIGIGFCTFTDTVLSVIGFNRFVAKPWQQKQFRNQFSDER
jgi:hypothetical protein